MLKPRRSSLQVPAMQPFRRFLHQKQKFLSSTAVRYIHNSHSLSSNPSRRLKLSRTPLYSSCRSFHAGGNLLSEEESIAFSEEESMACSDAGHHPSGKPASWTSYDPLTDQLGGKNSEGEAESSEDEDKPKVWSFYDPIDGKMVMLPLDHGKEEEPSRGEEVPKAEKKYAKKKSSPIPPGEEPQGGGRKVSVISGIGKKKVGKSKISWFCESCGGEFGQWFGTCPTCETACSIKSFTETEVRKTRGAEVSDAVVRSWMPEQSRMTKPQSLADVNTEKDESKWRILLSEDFGMEVSRVLGGGVVPGSLVLVGGDPGVGKSTLLLQIADIIAQGSAVREAAPVIYVSGEESTEQIGNRAARMKITTKEIYLYSSTDIEDILDKVKDLSPRALIVDSVQTVYLRGVIGSAGNISQVKECTSALLRFAKQTNIPVLLIGHVTKTGDIAGPRMLEHIVDVVLYLEGERYSSYRLLRSVKNRFGPTDELGVFEMSESGLQAVKNPSEMFLSEQSCASEILTGLAVAVIVDGSRTFLIEIQALCVSESQVVRQINGVETKRADMIISVLMKQAGLKLQDITIFLNAVSGIKLTETAGDLAIAASICSSFLEFPIPNDVAFIGEIGLGGELRAVPRMDKRVISVAKLGYKRCIIPKASEKLLTALDPEITIVGCKDLKEMINTVFQTE